MNQSDDELDAIQARIDADLKEAKALKVVAGPRTFSTLVGGGETATFVW